MAAHATRKRELIGALAGTVLEIGAGAGANFGFLPPGVTWLGLEPDPGRRRRLARAAAARGHRAPVIAAPAERIPLGDATVDAVLATLVLCSVADQGRSLAEVRRVDERGARPVPGAPVGETGVSALVGAAGNGGAEMAQDVRLGVAVMFVRDLDTSVSFYRDVLALEVADRSATAALLGNTAGTQLVLRAMGGTTAHTLGAVGVQYVVWTTATEEDLDECERKLRQRSAYRERHSSADVIAVEGRDPDDIVLMIVYAGKDRLPLHELPARIYAW